MSEGSVETGDTAGPVFADNKNPPKPHVVTRVWRDLLFVNREYGV